MIFLYTQNPNGHIFKSSDGFKFTSILNLVFVTINKNVSNWSFNVTNALFRFRLTTRVSCLKLIKHSLY
jgi:hypothetical protein